MLPKGITVRKVRASQGRIADNVSHRRLSGKCNRNKPPRLFWKAQNCDGLFDMQSFYVTRVVLGRNPSDFIFIRHIIALTCSVVRRYDDEYAITISASSKAIEVRMERRGKSSPVPMVT